MKDANITIHRASPDDVGLLTQLSAKTFYDTYAAALDLELLVAFIQQTFNLERQVEELADPANCFLIAEVDGVPAGYAMLRQGMSTPVIRGSHVIELARIYLLQKYQGYGLGSRLMQACLDEAKTQGCDVLWLGVWEHNPEAITFYKKWGFEQVGAHSFQFGEETQTDLLFHRSI